MSEEHYDIIICGAGLSGLSLAYRAFKSKVWQEERVLIVDKDRKDKNDRTWCFWQAAPSPFEDILYHQWEELLFFSNSGEAKVLEAAPYRYKMIRGIDFYRHTMAFLEKIPGITFVYDAIEKIHSENDVAKVCCATRTYSARYLFNSIYQKPHLKAHQQYFLQHFKGIKIRTDQFKGNPKAMHLMDFRTSQEHGTSFFYVLPFNQKELFVEYTLFSKTLLDHETYNEKIKEYLHDILHIDLYDVLESEFGVIPMTDYSFTRNEKNIIHLGSMGGDTRGSTGYTFTNVQRTVGKILEKYRVEGHPYFDVATISKRHQLYDKALLRVLDRERYPGHLLFSDLFKNTEAYHIFAFLNGESSLPQDFKIMSSLKSRHFIGPFLKAVSHGS